MPCLDTTMIDHPQPPLDWHLLLSSLRNELAALDQGARDWLVQRIKAIEELQVKLDALSRSAGGPEICAACTDHCCGCGRHHLTLTNLLAFLVNGEQPPPPDYQRTCPFLGERGCILQVTRRPYNCITFFCEVLEDRLDHEQREQLRCLDRQLRDIYQGIAERYPVASLRGLLISLQRAGDGHLLFSPKQDVLE